MHGSFSSPLIMVFVLQFKLGAHLPSIRLMSGDIGNSPTALRMANSEALNMFTLSISSTSARPRAQYRDCSHIASARTCRLFADSFFESVNPGRLNLAGNITAAAITGPAKGPRPTSSTPALSNRLPPLVYLATCVASIAHTASAAFSLAPQRREVMISLNASLTI